MRQTFRLHLSSHADGASSILTFDCCHLIMLASMRSSMRWPMAHCGALLKSATARAVGLNGRDFADSSSASGFAISGVTGAHRCFSSRFSPRPRSSSKKASVDSNLIMKTLLEFQGNVDARFDEVKTDLQDVKSRLDSIEQGVRLEGDHRPMSILCREILKSSPVRLDLFLSQSDFDANLFVASDASLPSLWSLSHHAEWPTQKSPLLFQRWFYASFYKDILFEFERTSTHPTTVACLIGTPGIGTCRV